MQLIWQKFQISFTLTTSTFEWWKKKAIFCPWSTQNFLDLTAYNNNTLFEQSSTEWVSM